MVEKTEITCLAEWKFMKRKKYHVMDLTYSTEVGLYTWKNHELRIVSVGIG